MAFGKPIAVEEDELLEPLQKVVIATAVLPPAQRKGGDRIGSRRSSQAKVDASGKQRFQHLELSATISGAWFGSMTPPEPTRMCWVAAAICPIMMSGAELAMDARL